jgi:hypothetical protein
MHSILHGLFYSFNSLQDVTDEEQPTTSFRSHNNDIFGDRQQLIQEITQFIMASCTKRGYAKDEDLGQFFANKSEREKREEIMEAAKKELDGLFGLKVVVLLVLYVF